MNLCIKNIYLLNMYRKYPVVITMKGSKKSVEFSVSIRYGLTPSKYVNKILTFLCRIFFVLYPFKNFDKSTGKLKIELFNQVLCPLLFRF